MQLFKQPLIFSFRSIALLCLLAGYGCWSCVSAQQIVPEQADAGSYLRLVQQAGNQAAPQALELSIVRFTSRDQDQPLSVDLISAMHIADRQYYAELNQRFKQYDSVLYELVADPLQVNGQPGSGSGSETSSSTRRSAGLSLVSKVQLWLKNTLELSFQLEEIDYRAGNFVHADMTPREFSASMEQRGESFFSTFMDLWRASIQQSLQQPVRGGDLDLLKALFAKDRAHELKLIAAQQFLQLESFSEALAGDDGSTLLTERNRKALQVLQQRIDAGDQRLAIFYGAAHMPDFAMHLQHDFKLEVDQISWIEAWDLRFESPPVSP